MITDELQVRLSFWLGYNFPNAKSDDQLKGIMEELGKLCHADLKESQGIRGYTKEKADAEIKDAVGDIVIFLCNYCTTKRIDFKECVDVAFDEITKRDWQKNPEGTPNVDKLQD